MYLPPASTEIPSDLCRDSTSSMVRQSIVAPCPAAPESAEVDPVTAGLGSTPPVSPLYPRPNFMPSVNSMIGLPTEPSPGCQSCRRGTAPAPAGMGCQARLQPFPAHMKPLSSNLHNPL